MDETKAGKENGNLRNKIVEKEKKIKKKTKTLGSEFKKFITKGNVVDLAIAVVIGSAFNKIVSGLVNFIITPILGIFAGGIDMTQWKIVLKEATETKAELAILYGSFLQSIIDFLIVALCLFLGLKIFTMVNNKIKQKDLETQKAETEKKKAEEKVKADAAKLQAEEKSNTEKRFYENIENQSSLLREILEQLKASK